MNSPDSPPRAATASLSASTAKVGTLYASEGANDADAEPSPASALSPAWLRPLAGIGLGLLLAAALAIFTLALLGEAYAAARFAPAPVGPASGKREIRALERLAAARPRGLYVIVDTHRNRVRIEKNGARVKEAICSTGSGIVLRDPRDGREWIFDTPNGERSVQRKVKNPVWSKPDWAFIEEGYTPPPAGSPDRFDDFSLGNYGLYLGDGYIIHGTIFQSLLGRRVTHGCIRLGDADLEWVYKNVPVGAKVYLY